jgi:predicted ATPase
MRVSLLTELCVTNRLLSIRLLGEFTLAYGNIPVTGVAMPRLQALLTYLLLHRNAPQSRQHLAFLFWPDTAEAQAYTNLRQLLHHLRRAWPAVEDFLQINPRTLQWKPDAVFTLDIVAFEQALAQAAAIPDAQVEVARVRLAEAVALYGGDLLPDCYEEWLLTERERLRQCLLNALQQLVLLCERQRDYPAAIHHAHRLLRTDPLHETTYRRLMRLHALNGDRASALRTYHTCAHMLARELGAEPNSGTQEVYARLLALERPLTPEAAPAARTAGMERLVGRRAEWEKLQAAWQTAIHGHAHFVCIMGEAGIGKTRLAEELLNWARHQGITTARTRSYAAEGDLAYAPVIEWLRSEALQATLMRLEPIWRTELARLLPELLAQQPQLPRPEPLAERWQRQRLFEALARAVLAGTQPLLLAIDDLQWSDLETLEWLHYLLRFDPKARLLVVGMMRPEEVDDQHALTTLLLHLRSAGQVTEFELNRLDLDETAVLAAQITDQPLDTKATMHLYRQTEGNPLFVVEMVRMAWRSGDNEGERQEEPTKPASLSAVPPKVHAVIQARLSQLSPPARALANLAAVIGRAFTFAELAQAGDSDQESLVRALDELWQRRIVREHGVNAYDFSHDYIREVAYAGISPVRRRACHARIAETFRQLYENDLDVVSAVLAVHCERAGIPAQAIRWYQQAAGVAERRFDYRSAIHYLDASLALQKDLPDTKQRTDQELTLLLAKTANLVVVHGFTSPEVAKVNAQVEPIVERIDDDRLRFRTLARLRQFYSVAGNMEKAYKYAEQLLSLALRLQEPELQPDAYHAWGIVNLQLGRFPLAKQALVQGQAQQVKQGSNSLATEVSYRGSAPTLGGLAFTLWLLGYPDQALAKMSEALALAETAANPFQLSITLFHATLLYGHMRAATLISAPAARVLALDTQYDIRMSGPAGALARGWLLAEQGDIAEGIAQMRAGINGYKAFNHTMYQTHRLGLLAVAQLKAGQLDTASSTLDEAFSLSEQSGQRSWDADLYRLKGELLRAGHAPDTEATTYYEQALQIARQQAAKSLELRATLSLARLWQQQARLAAAHAMLAEIYSWFTEGFETTDLQEAKALLEELNSQIRAQSSP